MEATKAQYKLRLDDPLGVNDIGATVAGFNLLQKSMDPLVKFPRLTSKNKVALGLLGGVASVVAPEETAGAINTGIDLVEGFLSPVGIAAIAAGPEAGTVGRALIGAAFGLPMALEVPELAREAGRMDVVGTPEEKIASRNRLISGIGMPAMIGAGVGMDFKRGGVTLPSPLRRAPDLRTIDLNNSSRLTEPLPLNGEFSPLPARVTPEVPGVSPTKPVEAVRPGEMVPIEAIPQKPVEQAAPVEILTGDQPAAPVEAAPKPQAAVSLPKMPPQEPMNSVDAHDFAQWARGKTVKELRQLRDDHEADPTSNSAEAIDIINSVIKEKSPSLSGEFVPGPGMVPIESVPKTPADPSPAPVEAAAPAADPNNYTPAVRAGKNAPPIVGQKGQTHQDIHKAQGDESAVNLSIVENIDHGFIGPDGAWVSKSALGERLGQKAPVDSQKLRELQGGEAAEPAAPAAEPVAWKKGDRVEVNGKVMTISGTSPDGKFALMKEGPAQFVKDLKPAPPEAAPVAAEAAPAAEQPPVVPQPKKLTPRQQAIQDQRDIRTKQREFDKLLIDYAPQLGWVDRPEFLVIPETMDGALAGAGGAERAAQIRLAWRRISEQTDIPLDDLQPKFFLGRARNLEKLKALINRRLAEEAASRDMPTVPKEAEQAGVDAWDADIGAEAPAPVPAQVAAEAKLGTGQKQGDLVTSTQAEPLALVGERAVDTERVAAEKAKLAADKAAAEAQQPPLIGMGGAIPGEYSGRGGGTSIKNAEIDKARRDRGLDPILAPERLKNEVVFDRVMGRIDREPHWQDDLINELQNKPRQINADEVLALDHKYVDLQNEYARATRDGAEAYTAKTEPGATQAAIESAQARLDGATLRIAEYGKRLAELEHVAKKVGTEWGRAGQMRQRIMLEDFTLDAMESRFRASKGFEPLNEAETAQVKAAFNKLKDLYEAEKEKSAELEIERSALAADVALAQQKAQAAAAYSPKVMAVAERFAGFMDKQADAARARIRARSGRTNMPLLGGDPVYIADLVVIGASKITRAVVKSEWIKEMMQEAEAMIDNGAEWVKPHLESIWEASNGRMEVDAGKWGESQGANPVKVQQRVRVKADAPTQIEKTRAAIERKVEKAKAEGREPNLHYEARKILRALVEENPKLTRQEAVEKVHAELSQFMPDMTELEAMDAISGRGIFSLPSQEVVEKAIRDLTTQIRLAGHQQDVIAGNPLPRTGPQRDVMSDEARRQQQILDDLKRQYGVTVTDAKTQLGSSLTAREAYYRNRAADLRQEIKDRTRRTRKPGSKETSPELEALKAEVAQLDKEAEAIFGKKEMTPEARVKLAIAAVERSIADLDGRIARGEIGPKKRLFKTPKSPELDAAKAHRDALMEQLQELRDADVGYQEARAVEGLESSIAEYERRIREGDLSKPAGSGVETPKMQALREKRTALADKLAELRAASPEAKQAALDAAIKAAQQAGVELQRRINEGDIAAKARKGPSVTNPALEAMRAENAEMAKMLGQLQRAARPKKSPEAIALQSLKARLATTLADYQRRNLEGDFSPRHKPAKEIPLDPEVAKLRADISLEKSKFEERLMQEQYKRKTKLQKAAINAGEALNVSRSVITSADLSAPLRQGAFIVVGNPARLAKGFAPMLRALRSDRNAQAVMEQIMARKNSVEGLYARAKLYLAPSEGSRMSLAEEAWMSKWAKKIPGVGASQRAYITFLNRLRADTFDSLLKNLEKDGVPATQAELEAIGNYVNVATGRGYLGSHAAAAETMATVFFSPRLVASRFQLLVGAPAWRGSARTRFMVGKEYAKFALGMATILALGKLAGATVEVDPRSSDFLKMKFGNTRVDPMAGLAQNTVMLTRVIGGKTKTARGEIKPLRGPKVKYGDQTVASVGGNFLRSKFSPWLGSGTDIAVGENVVGEPTTAGSVAKNALVPMAWQDVLNVMEEQGVARGTAIQALSLLGMGVQHYDAKRSRK
ncbi:MAG: hypothetical protein ACOYD4_03895 [Solirubrobacterales bacterium]